MRPARPISHLAIYGREFIRTNDPRSCQWQIVIRLQMNTAGVKGPWPVAKENLSYVVVKY